MKNATKKEESKAKHVNVPKDKGSKFKKKDYEKIK